MSRRVTFGAMLLLVTVATVFGLGRESSAKRLPYTPVVTPNGSTLPWEIVDGIKEFHLTVEEIMWGNGPWDDNQSLGLQWLNTWADDWSGAGRSRAILCYQ